MASPSLGPAHRVFVPGLGENFRATSDRFRWNFMRCNFTARDTSDRTGDAAGSSRLGRRRSWHWGVAGGRRQPPIRPARRPSSAGTTAARTPRRRSSARNGHRLDQLGQTRRRPAGAGVPGRPTARSSAATAPAATAGRSMTPSTATSRLRPAGPGPRPGPRRDRPRDAAASSIGRPAVSRSRRVAATRAVTRRDAGEGRHAAAARRAARPGSSPRRRSDRGTSTARGPQPAGRWTQPPSRQSRAMPPQRPVVLAGAGRTAGARPWPRGSRRPRRTAARRGRPARR